MNVTDLELLAEREKLARVLDVDAEELHVLDPIGIDGMRQLRGAVESHLHARGSRRFASLAKAAKMIPVAITGKIAEKSLGPRLAAKVTGLLAPELAVKLATHLAPDFLAEICCFLDPGRAGDVLRAMPEMVVCKVTAELLRAEDYITMARVVEALRDEQVAAVAGTLNAKALLWIGFYVESGLRLGQLMAMLEDDAVLAAMRAASEHNWWPQSLAIMVRADENNAARMTHLLAFAAPELSQSLLSATSENALWQPLSIVLGRSDASDLRRIESQISERAPELLNELRRHI